MNYKYNKYCNLIYCYDLKIGDYVITNDRPCKIKKINTYNENNMSFLQLHSLDIFTDCEYRMIISADEQIYSPIVTTNRYNVVDVILDSITDLSGTIKLMNDYGLKTLPIPRLCEKDKTIAVYIIDHFDWIKEKKFNGKLYVTTLCAFGEEHIKKLTIDILNKTL